MDLRKINDQFSVAPQITPQDVPAIKEAGFRTLICNRPDGEAMNQPAFAQIDAAAREHGMETLYLPISGGFISNETAERLARALREMPGPVLAYCRSGTRSCMAWALSQVGELDSAEIRSVAAKAGYDVSGVLS